MSKTLKQVQIKLFSIFIQYCDSENAVLDALAKGLINVAGNSYGITWSRRVPPQSALLEIGGCPEIYRFIELAF